MNRMIHNTVTIQNLSSPTHNTIHDSTTMVPIYAYIHTICNLF